MAHIRSYFGIAALLRSDASHHVIHYRDGKVRRSGRGLVFWFGPRRASIAELPMDDRVMTLFVNGRSKDFQQVAAQGTLTWKVSAPEKLAERVDFTVGLKSGKFEGEPIERLETRLTGLINQAALQYLAEAPVRELLDAGLEPLRLRVEQTLRATESLNQIGIEVVALGLTSLAPSNELERALQTPTFEALQQKADEATFSRRALAVDKERAIAENELSNKVELAKREKVLISEESTNARNRATGVAESRQIEAAAEAERIRTVESAKAETEQARMTIYRDLPPNVLMGLAARDLAHKLTKIEHVNITPDLLASLLGEFRKPTGGKD